MINQPFPRVVMVDPDYPLGMGAVKAAKKARAHSIPIEKLAGFQRACAPLFCQFTLELFSSALPGGLTVSPEFRIDEPQKPHIRLELLDTSRRIQRIYLSGVSGVTGGGVCSVAARGSFAA